MAKKLHPTLESAYGVRVGDRVEKRHGSLGEFLYGGGEVLDIRSNYTNGSGLRARIKRDPDPRYPDQPAIVLWDPMGLTVVQRAPGERVEGHPGHIPELPAPLVDPIDRLQHEIKAVKQRVKHIEHREDLRQRQMKDLRRLLLTTANRLESRKTPLTTRDTILILRALVKRIDLHNAIIDQG